MAEGLAPVALLGILKHPLAALGLAPQHCRTLARRLEMRILRGPAPPHGIAGLRAVLQERQDPELEAFVDRIEARLAPLLQIATATRALPAAALPVTALLALIQAAEAVAATEATSGASRLWALEEGEALAEHLTSLVAAFPILPEQPARILPGLLDVSLQGVVVRSRRALRGRGDTGEHPRVSILGLLEARLLSFDVLVLGSLAEAVWPPAADPGPWMSRPMRKAAGLASPEAAIGQMAHDFAMLCSAAPRVVLSCPLRRDGAPTVPARWLVRLEAMLSGYDAALEHNPATTWARALDQPNGPARAVRPPRPCPPLQARPRTLSVTEVETWLRDPYGIYARHVLGLRAMAPLEQAVENSDFGTVVHGAIASWVRALGLTFPPDAALLLRNEMVRALEARALRPALVAWWRPRLMRIADWVAEQEGARRIARPGVVVAVEVSGRWQVPGVPTPFELRGRADRIERRADGRLAILDYKTGVVPKGKEVEAGHAPQLPLEAAMAASGSFGPNMTGVAAELTYWRLTGGYVPGQIHEVFKGDPAATAAGVDTAATELARLVVKFDEPSQAYLSQPHPGAAPRFTDYAQVARVAEWSAVEDE